MKTLSKRYLPPALDDEHADMARLVSDTTKFIIAGHGSKCSGVMNSVRYSV